MDSWFPNYSLLKSFNDFIDPKVRKFCYGFNSEQVTDNFFNQLNCVGFNDEFINIINKKIKVNPMLLSLDEFNKHETNSYQFDTKSQISSTHTEFSNRKKRLLKRRSLKRKLEWLNNKTNPKLKRPKGNPKTKPPKIYLKRLKSKKRHFEEKKNDVEYSSFSMKQCRGKNFGFASPGKFPNFIVKDPYVYIMKINQQVDSNYTDDSNANSFDSEDDNTLHVDKCLNDKYKFSLINKHLDNGYEKVIKKGMVITRVGNDLYSDFFSIKFKTTSYKCIPNRLFNFEVRMNNDNKIIMKSGDFEIYSRKSSKIQEFWNQYKINKNNNKTSRMKIRRTKHINL